eukprot:TRINITY_DN31259_c0_g1_i3.p1 TRINITY_DN31259_c0_g1~~TRINITY_DN31259_c0_g1_i3.p1  ORF type:complete len:481 (+),score=110.15 TRINITY_DN31259_c0_g1_i3:182-1624(+)
MCIRDSEKIDPNEIFNWLLSNPRNFGAGGSSGFRIRRNTGHATSTLLHPHRSQRSMTDLLRQGHLLEDGAAAHQILESHLRMQPQSNHNYMGPQGGMNEGAGYPGALGSMSDEYCPLGSAGSPMGQGFTNVAAQQAVDNMYKASLPSSELVTYSSFVERNQHLLAKQSRRILEELGIVHQIPSWRVNLKAWVQDVIVQDLYYKLEERVLIPEPSNNPQAGSVFAAQNAAGQNPDERYKNQPKLRMVKEELLCTAFPSRQLEAIAPQVPQHHHEMLENARRLFCELEQYLNILPARYLHNINSEWAECRQVREHVIQRILAFARAGSVDLGCMSHEMTYYSKKMPSDQEIVLHLFCTYLDQNGPASQRGAQAPNERHTADFTSHFLVTQSENNRSSILVPQDVALVLKEWQPLHLQVSIFQKFKWDVAPGPENLWEALVLFLVFVTVEKPVSYTHLRAHETPEHLVCRLLLEKKKKNKKKE